MHGHDNLKIKLPKLDFIKPEYSLKIVSNWRLLIECLGKIVKLESLKLTKLVLNKGLLSTKKEALSAKPA